MSIRSRLRIGVARALFWAGFTAPARRGHERLSIATFHRVLRKRERDLYPYPNLAVTPEELDELLSFLTEHYDCGPLAIQHVRYLAQERSARPLLALTFDDGQHDNYAEAVPVLEDHKLKATFFVPVAGVVRGELLWHDHLGFALLALSGRGDEGRTRLKSILTSFGISSDSGDPVRAVTENSKRIDLTRRLKLIEAVSDAAQPYQEPAFARLMTFREIQGLAGMGHEIGSHSMTHCLMPECDDAALRYEMDESRRILQAETGAAIESFCYPNGDSDARSAEAALKAGYRRAVTTEWGANDRTSNPFQLRRFDIDAARVGSSTGKVLAPLVALRLSGFRLRAAY